MSAPYAVSVDQRGGLLIPSELCSLVGLAEGMQVVLVAAPGGLVLLSREVLRAAVRYELEGLDLVGVTAGAAASVDATLAVLSEPELLRAH